MPKLAKSRKKLYFSLSIIIVFIAVSVAAMLLLAFFLRAPEPNCLAKQRCTSKQFTIKSGESANTIINNLQKQRLIASPVVFKFYLRLHAKNLVFHPGVYDINSGMNARHLLEKLQQDFKSSTLNITFLPGASLAQNQQVLRRAGFKQADIDRAFKKSYQHPLLASKPASASLDGYIYGETYQIYKNASVETVLTRCFDEMYRFVKTNHLVEQYQKQGLSLHQGITLASVIQREAKTSDMNQVSQVFHLRLQKKLPLGSDAIIAYRADQLHPQRSKTDTSYLRSVDCPWNSRRCPGLPPSAINSPGRAALLAVANPAAGDYLYFLTGDDGHMYYAHTEAEHNSNIKNHCHEMCKIL